VSSWQAAELKGEATAAVESFSKETPTPAVEGSGLYFLQMGMDEQGSRTDSAFM
jgi:hypothetical protein